VTHPGKAAMTPTAETYDSIIVGGGYVGLALALALSRAFNGELRIAVVDAGALDATAPPRRDGRASALGAGSRRLLQTLGVWELLAGQTQDIAAIDITDSRLTDGIRPVLLSYETVLETGEPAMSIVSNDGLAGALRQAVYSAAGVTCHGNARVVSMTRDTGSARITLADGRTLQAALLVAADGRKSMLREAAGIKTVAWSHAQTGIVTTITHELPHLARAVQHFLPGGPFAILPLPGNRSCITWSEDTAVAEQLLAATDDVFLDAVEQRAGGKLGSIALDAPRQSWSLDTFLSRALVSDRLALLGDAARGVHPIAGQGLNLGLRDVAALADVTADAARSGQDIGSLAILERYERWRRADGALSASSFDALNRLFSNDLTVLRSLRDTGLGIVDRVPALKRRIVDEAAGLTGELPHLLRGVLP
jgi:2-octaprenyl-6-methoxyphenol hydroxylase